MERWIEGQEGQELMLSRTGRIRGGFQTHLLYRLDPSSVAEPHPSAVLPWSEHPAIQIVGPPGRPSPYVQLPLAPRFHWTVDAEGRLLTAEVAADRSVDRPGIGRAGMSVEPWDEIVSGVGLP